MFDAIVMYVNPPVSFSLPPFFWVCYLGVPQKVSGIHGLEKNKTRFKFISHEEDNGEGKQ
jgi:hypothetical protein